MIEMQYDEREAGLLAACTLENTSLLTLRGRRRVLARVLDVYDGDTLTVATYLVTSSANIVKVRIIGIDTPEIRSGDASSRALALRARNRVLSLLTGRPADDFVDKIQTEIRSALRSRAFVVILNGYGHDKYGRELCDVEVPGVGDVAAVLLAENLAAPYNA